MRVAYVECFSGISGDMFLGALLDVGVSEELLHKTNASLDIGTELRISRVDRTGVSATKVDVLVKGAVEQLSEHEHAHQECHSHPHEYAPTHDHHHAHGRSLSTIR